MARGAAHHHLVGRTGNLHQRIIGQIVPKRDVQIERGAGLIEHGNIEVGP